MSHSTSTYATLDEWIARAAMPCAVDASDVFDAAVDRLIAALGDAVELLGFGEALHGGEEILLLRNRLFQRLVQAHGYSAIAIESSFPRGRLVHEYVAGRGPASYADVQDAGFGNAFGSLVANRELVEWMRHYNADPAHQVKLQFYGFDMPTGTIGIASPHQVLAFVLDYFAEHDSASARQRRERIDALLGDDVDWENPAAIMDPTQSIGASPAATQLRIETEDLIAAMRARYPELVARSGAARYAEALHYAAMARQLLNFHAAMARPVDVAERLGLRDALMADNLTYIAARERGRGKLLAFAHNSHLKRGLAEWQSDVWWPVGAHLATMLGPRYAVIGSALGVSADNGIGQPEPGTLEARLLATPGPLRFIPTHGGQGLPDAEIAALPPRSGSRKNQSYSPLTPHSFSDFDGLAVLDSATYNRGGPPLHTWAAGAEQ